MSRGRHHDDALHVEARGWGAAFSAGAPLAHSGHTSRSLSYAIPWAVQRTIRTSEPFVGGPGRGAASGAGGPTVPSPAEGVRLSAGMDRALPSLVRPLPLDPHPAIRLRLPLARHPDVTPRSDGPVCRDPDAHRSTFAEIRAPGLVGDQAFRPGAVASSRFQGGARRVPSEPTVSRLRDSGNHPRKQREWAWVERHPVVRAPSCRASGAC